MISRCPAIQPAAIRFTDVTEQAGITFRHVASPEKKYLVESMSGGVAAFDYDNDGYLDIYFVNSLSVESGEVRRKDQERPLSTTTATAHLPMSLIRPV